MYTFYIRNNWHLFCDYLLVYFIAKVCKVDCKQVQPQNDVLPQLEDWIIKNKSKYLTIVTLCDQIVVQENPLK